MENASRQLNADQQLVVELHQRYRTPEGGIRWMEAFQANPEWAKRLSYGPNDKNHKKAHNIAQFLRSKGLLGVSPRQEVKTEGLTMNRSGTPRKLRPLTAKARKILAVMVEHGGENGYLDYHVLDRDHQGWDAGLGPRKKLMGTVSRMRAKGRFARERATLGLNGHQEPTIPTARVVEPSAPGTEAASNTEERLSEQALAKLIRREVSTTIDLMLGESRCCQRCGKSYEKQIREALAEIKFNQ